MNVRAWRSSASRALKAIEDVGRRVESAYRGDAGGACSRKVVSQLQCEAEPSSDGADTGLLQSQ